MIDFKVKNRGKISSQESVFIIEPFLSTQYIQVSHLIKKCWLLSLIETQLSRICFHFSFHRNQSSTQYKMNHRSHLSFFENYLQRSFTKVQPSSHFQCFIFILFCLPSSTCFTWFQSSLPSFPARFLCNCLRNFLYRIC